MSECINTQEQMLNECLLINNFHPDLSIDLFIHSFTHPFIHLSTFHEPYGHYWLRIQT